MGNGDTTNHQQLPSTEDAMNLSISASLSTFKPMGMPQDTGYMTVYLLRELLFEVRELNDRLAGQDAVAAPDAKPLSAKQLKSALGKLNGVVAKAADSLQPAALNSPDTVLVETQPETGAVSNRPTAERQPVGRRKPGRKRRGE